MRLNNLFEAQTEESLDYLNSDAAFASIAADAYWPKWNSPWWHMLVLHEMGMTHKIPDRIVRAYVDALNRIPLKIFPILPTDIPDGVDPSRGSPCHCQLGTVYQVLAAWGIDVDCDLPWLRPWFLRYQMADGGLNCDSEAYLVRGECPSSMVGTISVFEAVLLYTKRPWTSEEEAFIAKGAEFLISRQLIYGSTTKHNVSEAADQEKWLKPCFPRFYHYDVLRGLSALLHWADKTGQSVPIDAVRTVIKYLRDEFPDDQVRIGRIGFVSEGTLLQASDETWLRRQPVSRFALLDDVSTVGQISPYLSRQWIDLKAMIANDLNLRGLLK